MLMITGVEPSAKDLELINKNNIVHEVGGESEVGGAKFQAKLVKSNNTIRPDFLAKSKLLTEPISSAGFLTSKTRLAFAKLR